MGHELLHALRHAQKPVYEALVKGMASLIRNEARYAAEVTEAYTRIGRKAPVGDKMHEELIADIACRYFIDGQFWRDLENHLPRTLFERALLAITEMFRVVMEKMGLRSKVDVAENHLTNVDLARQEIAKAFRAFAADKTVPEPSKGLTYATDGRGGPLCPLSVPSDIAVVSPGTAPPLVPCLSLAT